jgi:prepilin-type N-terminal cleavage/methylation domain-containing protein
VKRGAPIPGRASATDSRGSVGGRSGFTLIEMLTVLVIVGILIGFSVPAITHLSRSTALPGALRQIANEASLARQYAITHRVQAELRITNTQIAVSVFTNGFPVDKWNYLPAGTFVDTSSVSSVSFTPTGGTTYGNEVSICAREGTLETNIANNTFTIYGVNSNMGTISINNLLGRIKISRP